MSRPRLTLVSIWEQYLENVVRVDRKRGAAKDDYICSEVAELHTKCEIAWMRLEIAGCKPLYIITNPVKETVLVSNSLKSRSGN